MTFPQNPNQPFDRRQTQEIPAVPQYHPGQHWQQDPDRGGATALHRAPAKKPLWKKPTSWVIGILLLTVIGQASEGTSTEAQSAAASVESSAPTPDPNTFPSAPEPVDEIDEPAPGYGKPVPDVDVEPTPEPSRSIPAPKPAPEPAPAKPSSGGTTSQTNALEKAESYLSWTSFSRQGLIDQLSSEYGEGFSVADATWAVDQLDVDWNEQAAEKAESYLSWTSFSCSGLIDQLSSEYGEQFTDAQARHGAESVGLC